MRYNPLGRTGLFVSELCLGAMTFGAGEGMWKSIAGLGQDDATAMIEAAIAAGINFIDTADVYTGGQSERITGQALRDLGVPRDEIVVATKAFGPTGQGPNSRGNTRYHLLDAVKRSLDRLQLDHIDLYQLHGWDVATPIEETLRALDTLVSHGHVRYVGVSNWTAWQIVKALGISEHRGLARFQSVQAYFSLVGRELERELAPMMASEGLGLMVWSPLAGGFLSGKYSGGGENEGRRSSFGFPPVDPARGDAVVEAMRPIATARGVSVAAVALAWLLHQPVVTSVIVGARRMDQLADNIAAAGVVLSAEDLASLDAASALTPEYPAWIFDMQGRNRAAQLNPPPRGG